VNKLINPDETWLGDWEERCRHRLACEGFTSMTAYLKSREGVTYSKVAKQLDGCAPLQVALMQFREAREKKTLRNVSKDSLVRTIRERMKRGWDVSIHRRRQRTSAFVQWLSILRCDQAFVGNEACDEQSVLMSKRGEDVWRVLEESAVVGWLPESADDPVITKAFDEGWPVQPAAH